MADHFRWEPVASIASVTDRFHALLFARWLSQPR
jgi:hypothetical protein